MFPCPQKILMLTDSSFDFETNGFGLSEFVDFIANVGYVVATAHQNGRRKGTRKLLGSLFGKK